MFLIYIISVFQNIVRNNNILGGAKVGTYTALIGLLILFKLSSTEYLHAS